jgi:hypothetical protein
VKKLSTNMAHPSQPTIGEQLTASHPLRPGTSLAGIAGIAGSKQAPQKEFSATPCAQRRECPANS